MKQAILYGARDLRIEESELDCENLQPDQIYAETIVSALSTGTDLGNFLGDSTYVPGAPDYPRRIGYSNVAFVRQVGTKVLQPTVGQRVFSTQPHQSAYIAQQSDILVTVPESVSSEQASLAYLTHLGLAALRQANYLPGENVVVVGLGSLIPYTVNAFLTLSFVAVGKERPVGLALTVSLIGLVLMNLWWIPLLGPQGAAWAILAAECIQSAVLLADKTGARLAIEGGAHELSKLS